MNFLFSLLIILINGFMAYLCWDLWKINKRLRNEIMKVNRLRDLWK